MGVQGSAAVARWGPVVGHTPSARAYAGSVESDKRTAGPVATPERAFVKTGRKVARLHSRGIHPKLGPPRVVDQLMAPPISAECADSRARWRTECPEPLVTRVRERSRS